MIFGIFTSILLSNLLFMVTHTPHCRRSELSAMLMPRPCGSTACRLISGARLTLTRRWSHSFAPSTSTARSVLDITAWHKFNANDCLSIVKMICWYMDIQLVLLFFLLDRFFTDNLTSIQYKRKATDPPMPAAPTPVAAPVVDVSLGIAMVWYGLTMHY